MSHDEQASKLEDELAAIADSIAPASCLTVVGEDIPLPALGGRIHYSPSEAGTLIESPVAQLVDLAILDSRAALDESSVRILLSRLRDLLARRVLIIVRTDAEAIWARQTMIGCGYTYLTSCLHADETVHLFQFDIATYKHTPDWLGPSNWANPEMWDKYRW